MTWLNPVVAATTGPLIDAVQLAGGNFADVQIDGSLLLEGDRVLVKDEPSQVPFQNGVYLVLGDGHWVFLDEAEPGDAKLLVIGGDTNRDTIFFLDDHGDWLAVIPASVSSTDVQDPGPQSGPGEGWDDDPLSLGNR